MVSKAARAIINSVKPQRTRVPKGPTKLGSAGYDNPRDDIEKTKSLREGSVEKVPVNDNDIANKKYVDDQILNSVRTASITIENPTATEDLSIFFTNRPITIKEIRAVLLGSATPSVTWTIRHSTDRSTTGAEVVNSGTVTTSTTSGSDVTSFNDATILLDSFIWIETTAQSGTVTELHVTIVFTED